MLSCVFACKHTRQHPLGRRDRPPLRLCAVTLQLEQIWLLQCPECVIPQFSSLLTAWYRVDDGAVEANVRAFKRNSRHAEPVIALYCLFMIGDHLLNGLFVGQRRIYQFGAEPGSLRACSHYRAFAQALLTTMCGVTERNIELL